MRVGFIGTGIMGSNMVKNLMDAGEKVTIYNRTKQKAQHLLDAGAGWRETPRELVSKVDVVFTMLSNPEAVEEIANSVDGLLAGETSRKIWVDMSTVNPGFTRQMAKTAKMKEMRLVDAPVSGSKGPAEKGELVFLAGGREEDVQKVQPLLEIMGKNVHYMGGTGSGSAMKMSVNLTLMHAMTSLSEGLHAAEGLGLDKEQALDVLLQVPTTAPAVAGKRDMLLSGSYETQFPLKHAYKDLHLLEESAYQAGISLPVTGSVREAYALAKQYGMGDEDFAAVYKLLSKGSE
ncbi:NAD(P)-dependent oxidoreductase [Marinococcus halotolerans]|uniref:NAD(P)-dependent oxidoreductase n=1 Tax=Marinococcus halotolerans TaxID=301092 RepID=UPI0003B50719|nr:NAD(P)-dependent oxidoreductase [Marinococcus halotolerans]